MRSNHPPKWADRLLEKIFRPDLLDEVQGDLHEAYYWRLETNGPAKAGNHFIREVLLSFRPQNIRPIYHLSLNTMIFRNYMKIAFRSLLNRKAFSFINIFGLSVGVAAFLLIFLYAFQILTYDGFNERKDRTFLVYKERITPDGTQATYDTWVPMKDRLLTEYEQVTEATRYYDTEASIIQNNRYLEEEIIYTDESFFRIFSFPVKFGNQQNLFTNKNSVVISEKMAWKYYGKANAIGEPMELFLSSEDTIMRYYVSAILEDIPENSSYQPNLVIQAISIPVFPQYANNWGSSFLETLVLLDESQNAEYLEGAFPDLIESIWGPETRGNTNFKLLPFNQYYDTFIGDKSDAHTLLWIGLGILLIAMINFMNLSTAQSSQRAKEIGLRKVLGAYRSQLRTQFITEALVNSFLATLVGFLIATLLVPYFNGFFDTSISFTTFSIIEIVAFILSLVVTLGILSGSYPAIYLSSIRAIDVIRYKLGVGGSISFRNALVVVQFSIAVFLISISIIVRNQIIYMTEKPMGFDQEGKLIISASSSDFTDREEGVIRLNTFKGQLQSQSYINEVTMSRAVPTFWTRSFTFVRPDGWNGDPLRMRYTYVDARFFETYNIPIKYGTSFLEDSEGDQRRSVILNEAALAAFQFDPSETNVIKIGDHRLNVIGVVEDFNFESLRNEVAPTLFFHRTAKHPVHTYITCNLEPSQIQARLGEIEEMWGNLGSTQSFTYSFMDDRVTSLYESEQRYMGMVSMFSVISIIVACLGLYGLTLFIIEKRRKEISIRKVLGAEIAALLGMIFRDFARWIMIAFIISVPLVIYFVQGWLQNYHYRIEISWLTFGISLVIVLILVALTVGYQSLKAASANPVIYLKDE